MKRRARELSKDERGLLEWLQDGGQYGECKGKSLDRLIELGLAEITAPRDGQFIAQGPGLDYQAVTLTEAGRALINA